MNIKAVSAVALVFSLLSASVQADFKLGAMYYEQGDMQKAYEEFKLASAYGDKDAQFNIAAMYFRGQHLDKDLVKSYAWFALSGATGHPQGSELSDKVYNRLSAEQKAQADKEKNKLLSQYSKENIINSLSPELSLGAAVSEPYKVLRRKAPEYPRNMARRGKTGWVDVMYTIAEDGTTRDHTVLYSNEKGFDNAAIEATRASLYEPRTVNGKPVVTPGVRIRMVFQLAGNYLVASKLEELLAEQKQQAETGDASEQFVYGYTLGAASSFTDGLTNRFGEEVEIQGFKENANTWFEKAAANDNASAAYFLGLNTLQGRYCERDTYKSAGWLYRAAMLGNADAKYALAIEYMGGASFPKDETKGLYWLSEAAQSLPEAKLRYAAYLARSENNNQDAIAKAREYFSQVPEDHADRLTYYEVAAAVASAEGDLASAKNWQEKAVKEAESLDLPLERYKSTLSNYEKSIKNNKSA
ncbi:TonB family protein [Gilvimarinus sp. DA14]|uniref:TonB family protein n=1 Tax=Gilvimarinus sp. DA14 TaxID=2956798 RepID=UPI0020B7E3CC|nr:TonB family protein [Gilvimarinus sp. DA14]UTF58841.1 TonB family protein [Gilvimarinus sp. DA14]